MSRDIEQAIISQYGLVAASGLSSEHSGVRQVAEAFGYSAGELAEIPAEANMGLSCGNPTAFASLKPGETVVDLGCGGGLDVFLAAARVGPAGKAIGIDMTPEMIELARRNASRGVNGRPIENVEFHEAVIDRLPLAAGSVDCIISNCVINLARDKGAVFREMARVLRPLGRVAISDIALKQPLPTELSTSLMAYVGCVAGAISIAEYRQGLFDAGFSAVDIVDSRADLNAYALVENQAACCSPAMSGEGLLVVAGCDGPAVSESPLHSALADLLRRYDINDYAASVRIYAIKR